MLISLARIDCDGIIDWNSFHDVFDRVFQFPDFYGRNMNAWVDCMTSLDEPEDGLTGIHCEPGRVLTIELAGAKAFKNRCPEQFEAIIECSAFVNWRRIDVGLPSVLALSFRA